MWATLLLLLLAHNLVVAAAFGLDKGRAKQGARRISERTLLTMAALFGAPGALLAMQVVRHKTQKPRFRWGIPALLVIQLVLAAALAWMALTSGAVSL